MARLDTLALGRAVLFALLVPIGVNAQEGPVRVEIVGVEGELRRNVLATLTLSTSAARAVMTEPRVRQLHARAPREIALALQAFGRYQAQVDATLRFDNGRWVARYAIDAGSPVQVSRVDVRIEGDGEADPAMQRALQRSPLQVGEPLHHGRYAATKAALEGVAAERGYLDASFDSSVIRVDREARTAEILLHFQTGPRFVFGTVTFLQEVLDPEILQQLVPFQTGEPFDAAQLLTLRNALADGPYFTSVEIVPRRDRAEGLVVPVEVHLSPQPARRYLVGFGYGTDTGPRGTTNVEIRRLNQSGHRAEAEARVSLIERRVSGRYFLPLRGLRASLLTISTGFVDASPTTSDTETFFVGVNLGGTLGGWRSDLSLTLQRAAFEVGVDSGVSTLLVLGTGLSRVRADDRIFPTRGSLLGLRVRGGHEALLSDTRFLQVTLEGKLVRSLGAGTRLLARGDVGAVFSPDFRGLPGSLRHFTGGDRSLRGYAYQSLGPSDEVGNVIGGQRLLVGSLELDRRVFDRWGVAVFLDAGNALSSFTDELEAGAGVGVRWRSPMGPIRLDGAFAVSRAGAPFRLHLVIGPEL